MIHLFKHTRQWGRRGLLLLLTVLTFTACGTSDDEVLPDDVPVDYPVAQRPNWVVETPANASVNMTVYVHIDEQFTISSDDLMGAFIGDKCRAMGRMTDGNSFVLTIKGAADEFAPITLIYYNAAARRLLTDKGHINFLADDIIGLDEVYEFRE